MLTPSARKARLPICAPLAIDTSGSTTAGGTTRPSTVADASTATNVSPRRAPTIGLTLPSRMSNVTCR